MRIFYLFLLFNVCLSVTLLAQQDSIFNDTLQTQKLSTEILESTDKTSDSLATMNSGKFVQISKDSLDAKVEYSSDTREVMDVNNKIVHLYGNAVVKYKNIEVRGEYIQFDFENNIAIAEAQYDDHGHLISKANFVEGKNTFQYNYLKYNFKSKKGIVKQAVTKEGDLFVHGGLTKFISMQDSIENDIIYNKDAIVTSCNHNHPHFGIRSNKLKVVPQKLAIIGPSRLEIADIPTPLWLPFGFFPIMNGKSAGLILPRNYDLDTRYGFGLKGVGYYFPINDYWDAKITGDIYLRGSWVIRNEMKYKKNYRYSGGLSLTRSSYNNEDLAGDSYIRNVSYSFTWNHNQDAKAHPYQSFNSNIRIETAGFNQQNRLSAYNRNNDVISSSLNYSYQFGESPFSIAVGARATQSLSTHKMSITLPDVKIKMRSIYPFKRKKRIGKERFYEKIRLDYNSSFLNSLETTDSTFYKAESLQNIKTGIKHYAGMNANFKFLKYFSFNPSVRYNEIWYLNSYEKYLKNTLVLDTINEYQNDLNQTVYEVDTTFGIIEDRLNRDFLPFRQLSTSAGISTKLFGTKIWSKGALRGVRHIITPSLSISYIPETASKYTKVLDTDIREDVYAPIEYFNLPNNVFRSTPKDEALDFRLNANNELDIKWKTRRDSIAKKIRLTTFNYSLSYNAIKKSLSNFILSGNSNFFKGKSSIYYGFTVTPYKYIKGKQTEEYVWSGDNLSLPFVPNIYIRTTWRMSFNELKQLFTGDKKSPKSKNIHVKPSIFSLLDNFGINYKLNWEYHDNGIIKSYGIKKNSISFQGSIPITDKWNIDLGSLGYDFQNKGITYPEIGFSRDLHCWRMNFSWFPSASESGGAYRFFIGVNSNTLEFVKYNYNQGVFYN